MHGPKPLLPESARPDPPSESALTIGEGPALRDARSITARIAEDEAAAGDARERYQAEGLPTLEPDDRFSALHEPDEILHALHGSAQLELGPSANGTDATLGGGLYLTSQRLLHAGEQLNTVPLDDIEEMAVALERLVLIRLKHGADLALEVGQPRLLRVQIAAAKAARLGAGT